MRTLLLLTILAINVFADDTSSFLEALNCRVFNYGSFAKVGKIEEAQFYFFGGIGEKETKIVGNLTARVYAYDPKLPTSKRSLVVRFEGKLGNGKFAYATTNVEATVLPRNIGLGLTVPGSEELIGRINCIKEHMW